MDGRDRIFVSLDAGCGKSVIIAAMSYLKLRGIKSANAGKKLYIYSPSEYLSEAMKETFKQWFTTI
jgi:hypothetical protein